MQNPRTSRALHTGGREYLRELKTLHLGHRLRVTLTAAPTRMTARKQYPLNRKEPVADAKGPQD